MAAEMHITFHGDLRPAWLVALEEALAAAREQGWTPAGPIVMNGDPYIWDGEPRVATWTID